MKPGFTLIEAILGVTLLSAGFVGLMSIFQRSVSGSLEADRTVIATHLANETMEKIIAQKDCDEIGCGYAATLTSINTTGSYDSNPISGFSGFVLDSTALEVNPDNDNSTDDFLDASSGSNYARVTVKVSWNGGVDFVQLVTLLANY